MVAVLRLHLLKLVRSKNGCELLASLLMDCVHLLLHDHWGDGWVAFQCGDILVAIGEDRFEFRGLIGREIESLAEPGSFALRIFYMGVSFGCEWWCHVLLLCKGEASRESQGEGGGEQKAVHG